ncbi:hypothetical protein SAMN05216338_1001705 [Bradyrhizobium sp. Rc2d]|nr:hypothetical protein SAMN05216338_1001705 [Bradyrhizobium sp. Rc2d]
MHLPDRPRQAGPAGLYEIPITSPRPSSRKPMFTVARQRRAAGRPRIIAGRMDATRIISMMDILMLALGFAFFALAVGYTYACERL